MLTIDTIPLYINGKLKAENEKLNFPFSIFISITCSLCAGDGSGSDGKIS
jgi:hypothetical protein